MKKTPFIRSNSIKKIGLRYTVRFCMFLLLLYGVIPLISLIEWNFPMNNWLLWIIFPAAVVVSGCVLGLDHGCCWDLNLLTGIVFLPFGLIYSFDPFWHYAIGYFILSAASNTATELFRSTKKQQREKYNALIGERK